MVAICSLISATKRPATLIGPTKGKTTSPSRLTVDLWRRSGLPATDSSRTSPVLSLYSAWPADGRAATAHAAAARHSLVSEPGRERLFCEEGMGVRSG